MASHFFGPLTSNGLLFCSRSQIDLVILQNCYVTEILTSIPHNFISFQLSSNYSIILFNFIEISNNLTHSFVQYLVNIYHTPGTVLSTGYTALNMTNTIFALMELSLLFPRLSALLSISTSSRLVHV